MGARRQRTNPEVDEYSKTRLPVASGHHTVQEGLSMVYIYRYIYYVYSGPSSSLPTERTGNYQLSNQINKHTNCLGKDFKGRKKKKKEELAVVIKTDQYIMQS